MTGLEKSRVNYQYRLEVLYGYYNRIGNLDKRDWAGRELATYQNAQTFHWEGVPQVLPPQGESVENADERVLVEYAVASRRQYLDAANKVIAMLNANGDTYKAGRVKNVLDRMDLSHRFTFIAEIPPADLRPTQVVPEADKMFADAYHLFRRGKGLVPMVTTNYQDERNALQLFKELVNKYPSSTKIALSAYYIADIYKEYFNEDALAVQWYERAIQWAPNVTEPARFQAAVVYDLRMHNRAKAVEMYKGAIQYEQFNKSNVDFAHRRLEDLTGK